MKKLTSNQMKQGLAIVLLEMLDLEGSGTWPERYRRLNNAGYLWFPGQRAWCYRPDLLEKR